MEAGELTLETGEFNLINTIRSCIQSLTPRFEEKHGLELCWDISPGIPESVLGDSHRLRNILTNLIGNAFKFTDRGVVSFKVSRFESHIPGTFGVRFQVADSGIGIPENRLSHIFDPFTQADDSTARLYGGSGLGLAIVKQIVDKMGGSVRAQYSQSKFLLRRWGGQPRATGQIILEHEA
jgi:signal transduction histidine kinase